MKNLNLKILSNERGGMAALLSVIVLSMIMVSTLTSFYIYLENRARFQGRLRMNYQMGYVMEDISRSIVQARDLFVANSGACPVGTEIRFLDCSQVCAAPRPKGSDLPGGISHAVCVKNDNLNKIVKGADYFCAYNSDGGVVIPSYCSALTDNFSPNSEKTMVAAVSSEKSLSRMKSWYSRLDNFFDSTIVKNAPVLADKMYPVLQAEIQPPTIFGWLLPEKVYAKCVHPEDCPNPNSLGTRPKKKPPQMTAQAKKQPPNGSCDEDPVQSHCAKQCKGNSEKRPAFCKNLEAKITLAKIGATGGASGCTASSKDERCKRCSAIDRRTGGCLKVSVCPPWLPLRDCNRNGKDRRVHQMIKIGIPVASGSLPTYTPGPSIPPHPCLPQCASYGGPGCVSTPVQGGCRVDCSGNGTIYYLCK